MYLTKGAFGITQHLSGSILQHQLGLVHDEAVLRHGTGLRAEQIDNVVFNLDRTVNTEFSLCESKTVAPDLKYFSGIAKPATFQ